MKTTLIIILILLAFQLGAICVMKIQLDKIKKIIKRIDAKAKW